MSRFVGKSTLAASLSLCAAAMLTPTSGTAAGGIPGVADMVVIPPPGAGLGDPVWPQLGNAGYDVLDQRLAFTFSDSLVRYTARTTMTVRAAARLESFDLDLLGPSVITVRVDGHPANWRTTSQGELVVTPHSAVEAGQRFRVRVDVRDRVTTLATLTTFPPGLLRRGEWVQMIAQPSGARRALALSDHPAQKAPATVVITAPSRFASVANGHLVRTVRQGRRTTRVFRENRRLAPELLQVGVGPFTVLRRPGPHGLAMRFAVPTEQARAITPQLRSFDRSIHWLERRLGRFPGNIAGAYAPPLGGELETQGLTLMQADQLMPKGFAANGVEGIVLHEVAHEWFGNSVSPRQWSDLWLNEGHAVYYETLWSARKTGGTLARSMRELYEEAGDSLFDYGPIAAPHPSAWKGVEADLRPYSNAAYTGGALALFALREEVGETTFRRIERTWVRRYDNSVADTADFIALASQIADRDLRTLLEAWLYGDQLPPMPGHANWHSTP